MFSSTRQFCVDCGQEIAGLWLASSTPRKLHCDPCQASRPGPKPWFCNHCGANLASDRAHRLTPGQCPRAGQEMIATPAPDPEPAGCPACDGSGSERIRIGPDSAGDNLA